MLAPTITYSPRSGWPLEEAFLDAQIMDHAAHIRLHRELQFSRRRARR